MKNSDRGTRGLFVFLIIALCAPAILAHSPNVDADLTDWCIGAESNTAAGNGRIEDSGAVLTCGNCSGAANEDLACVVNSDCPSGSSCVNPNSREETAWWDNRTDGAVNDLGTVAITQDNDNLYIAAELWVDPDPVSLPFGEVAIDFAQGGLSVWHDPNGALTSAGRCSGFTDRACTSDADCHFCQLSREPTGGCSITETQSCALNSHCPGVETCVRRVRTCGSACDPDIGDVCDMSQTCEGLGAGGAQPNLGLLGSPKTLADYLVVFDFSLWLVSAGDSVLLMEPGTTVDANPWDPVLGCPPDFVGDTTVCDFEPAVNPGASGGSGGPPGSVEVAIPWSSFGCTGCPDACVCPGFGPGQDFRYTMTVARGTLSLDFTPDGAHEDVMSEAVGQTTSTTNNSCPEPPPGGADNTECELDDRTLDAFIPLSPSLPHELPAGGEACGVVISKSAPPNVTITFEWFDSCSAADDGYGLYEGLIGNWYSHDTQINCGATSGWTIVAPTENTYYLVVPNASGPNTEGSYGTDGSGSQRPVSNTACAAQSLGNCP